jgi:two-component system sensor histidine kinase PilS (NtrC family)
VLFAALASLAILAEQIYASQTHAFAESAFTYTGMLGASFITISILSYVLASRAEQTERLAGQQKLTISKLEELNLYIIQHLQSGIIIVDKEGQVGMLNEAALHLLELQISPWSLEAIAPDLASAFQSWRIDTRHDQTVLKLSKQTELNTRFALLPTQHEHFYMIILEDNAIYDQRLQQGKLASLGRLTASIAHEIRNPLGALSHAGQLLSECPDLKPEDKRLTEIIQTHSERVNRIIEDILQLSKRKASNREKIDLTIWNRDYLKKFLFSNNLDPQRFRLLIASKHLSAFIDKHHLEQIMDNLCQNALKYGATAKQQITIRLSAQQHHPCIEVIDTGPGISPENIKLLFEPFFTTSTTGTGLGLYISRELAELNLAKLSYHLTETNSSCFRLSLSNAERTQIEI